VEGNVPERGAAVFICILRISKYMKNLSVENFNQPVVIALENLHKSKEGSILLNFKGKRFIIMNEEDFQGWYETAYLLSSLKNKKILKKSIEEPIERCKDLNGILKKLENKTNFLNG
jgi:PHD/YefM family antitoxin component YafN of YafNO toxin-antitoxin module